MFSLHGAVMVFMFIIPSIPAILGNFILPAAAWRERRRLPAAQFAEPLDLHDRLAVFRLYLDWRRFAGRVWLACSPVLPGLDTGWTFLYTL